jgi:hypothetical protein
MINKFKQNYMVMFFCQRLTDDGEFLFCQGHRKKPKFKLIWHLRFYINLMVN